MSSIVQSHQQTFERTHPVLISCIFLLLGVSVLVPWNAFISAKNYFVQRLCHENTESVFAILFNVASVSSLGCVLLWQWLRGNTEATTSRVRRDEEALAVTYNNEAISNDADDTATRDAIRQDNVTKSNSHAYRMVMGSFSLNLAVFLGQSLLVLTTTTTTGTTSVFIYTSVLLCGLTSSIANAGIVMTGSSKLSYYFQGQAVGGLIVSAANFMAASMEDPAAFQKAQCRDKNQTDNDYNHHAAAFTTTNEFASIKRRLEDATCAYDTIDWAVLLYFLVGSLLLMGAMVGYQYVHRLERFQYDTLDNDTDGHDTTPRVGLEMSDPSHGHGERLTIRPASSSSLSTLNECVEATPICSSNALARTDSDLATVLYLVQAPACCIFFTFVVTLSMFPGWTSQLTSRWRCQSNFRLSNDLFTPLTFVLFNAGDLVGRIWSSAFDLTRVRNVSAKLVAGSLLRVLLAMMLFTCQGATQVFGFVIPVDLYSLLVQFAFAVSNGLLVTLSFAHAPTLLPPSDTVARERMSEILSFALSLGLMVGSFCSYPVSQLGR